MSRCCQVFQCSSRSRRTASLAGFFDLVAAIDRRSGSFLVSPDFFEAFLSRSQPAPDFNTLNREPIEFKRAERFSCFGHSLEVPQVVGELLAAGAGTNAGQAPPIKKEPFRVCILSIGIARGLRVESGWIDRRGDGAAGVVNLRRGFYPIPQKAARIAMVMAGRKAPFHGS